MNMDYEPEVPGSVDEWLDYIAWLVEQDKFATLMWAIEQYGAVMWDKGYDEAWSNKNE